MNTIVITAEIESGFVANTTWFHSAAVQFPCAQHHSKRRRRWVGVKGSTRNGRRDLKCSSARHLCIFREDTGAPSEGATCARMVADEKVGWKVFLTTPVVEDWQPPSVSDEKITKMRKLISKDRQVTVRMIDEELQINSESMRRIIIQNLGMRKTYYRY
ncbi:uncharacterized protein TNCV_3086261 [Trichonephila clavipes]|nr:uncharacterized protein TNCV_3086261 [Trichonephila clavipes]